MSLFEQPEGRIDIRGLSISLGADQANNGVLAADPDDWRNYRYKLFDTVIPLRNQVWSPA